MYRQSNEKNSVNHYYNNPLIGLNVSFHNLGNNSLFGNELNLLPVVGFPLKKGIIQLGLGVSYFTKTYRDNPLNKAVGSHITWCFQSFYYRNFLLASGKSLRIGFGYLHGSNGHTQLPNFGLNSAALSFGLYKKPAISRPVKTSANTQKTPMQVFITANFGVGFHEFGGTSAPVGGPKKLVYSSSIAGGVILNNQFRWYAGFGIRHYEHFADSIANSPELQALKVSPESFYFMMGAEFLIHHIGLSIEGGINIYKPFYEHFSREFESQESIKYHLRKIFLTRLGLRLYLFNTSDKPKHNFYLAPYLNANLGKADFSEISMGYIYNF
nr:acyloxyacyl hydrolase [Marivirga aurantiaca]